MACRSGASSSTSSRCFVESGIYKSANILTRETRPTCVVFRTRCGGSDTVSDPVSDPIISAMSVAVASHSFPKHAALRRELEARYPAAVYNTTGRPLAGDDLVRFLRGHEMAITGLEVLDQAVFSAVPELRIVSKYGVGLDMIDLAAASRSGVSVRWTGGVNRQAVAELAIAFMLVLGRSTVTLARAMRDGGWRQPGGRQL